MATLYLVHDPMCSWCWGFNATWQHIQDNLPQHIKVKKVLGGLAPDNTTPMPLEMREKLEHTWQQVHHVTGANFNYDFWRNNTPYRSTYPACRAVICATLQQQEEAMILAIQHAYYQQAQNVSLLETLVQCAEDISLDTQRFSSDMQSQATEQELQSQLNFARSIGGNSFPSLFFQATDNSVIHGIALSYTDAKITLAAIANQQ